MSLNSLRLLRSFRLARKPLRSTTGPGASLVVLIRHTDAEREWSYDRESHIGRLDAALEDAGNKNWVVVDMQRDWKTVYPATSN